METAETCSCVHDEVHENPVLRIKDLVDSEVSGVALIYGYHDLFGNCLESISATVVVINNSCGRLFADADILVAKCLMVSSDELTLVVVKCETYSGVKGKICRDVILGDIDFSILNILRVNELDLIDNVEFLEQHGAYESVKVTSGNKSLLVH